MPTDTVTNCPKCNALVTPGAEECAQCGILFSKWMQREENVASGNTARYRVAHATSSEFNWVILLIVCTVVIGIFYYIEHSAQ
jgi:hypothetical protein